MNTKKLVIKILCAIMVVCLCGCNSGTTVSEYSVYEYEDIPVDSFLNELENDASVSSDTGNSGNTAGGTSGEPLFSEPVTFTVFALEHPYQTYNTNTVKFQELTAATNVTLDIDVTSQSSYTAKQAAILASGQLYDINVLEFDKLSNYSPELFVNIDTYMKNGSLPNYSKWYDKLEFASWINIDGKIPGFIQVNAGNYPLTTEQQSTNGLYPCIRKDILSSNNLAIPSTYDDWFNVMKTLKAKYPDSTPISGRHKITLVKNFESSLGCYHGFYYDNDAKSFKLGILESGYRNVLSFLIKCYNEGILDKNFEECSSSTWEEGVAKNKIFFWIDNDTFSEYQTATLRNSNPNADFSVMPLMENLFGKKVGYEFADSWYETTYCLNAKSDKIDKLIKFMDWCYSDEAMYINNYGKENVTYTVNSDGSVSIPSKIAERYKNKTYPYYSYAADFGLGQLSFSPLVRNTGELPAAISGVEESKAYNTLKNDIAAGNVKTNVNITPAVSSDKRESITAKADAIEKLMEENIYDLITGRKSLSELDSLISQIRSLGAQEVIEAYNAAIK